MHQREIMVRDREIKTANIKPYVTWGLMYLMVFAYVLVLTKQMITPYYEASILEKWGMVPAQFSQDYLYLPVITAIFLHSGPLHLAVNVLFCYAFAPYVERKIGPLWFAIFFVTCGVGGNILQGLLDQSSQIPVVGASGAISGLIAYVIVATWGRNTTSKPTPLVWLQKLLIGFFALDAILNAIARVFESNALSDTAFAAHLGGFATGFIISLARLRRLPRL